MHAIIALTQHGFIIIIIIITSDLIVRYDPRNDRRQDSDTTYTPSPIHALNSATAC